MGEDWNDRADAYSSDVELFQQAARLPRWFSAAALQPVIDLNRRMLELMAAQSSGLIVTDDIARALRSLPSCALDRIAQCPCLLVTAGFDDETRWTHAKELAANCSPARTTREHNVDAAISLARETLFVAWHYVRTYSDAANLVIGTCAASAQSLRGLTVEELERLAAAYSDWVQPRWADRPTCWEMLLVTGEIGVPPHMADLRGLQLVLGERLHGFTAEVMKMHT